MSLPLHSRRKAQVDTNKKLIQGGKAYTKSSRPKFTTGQKHAGSAATKY